MIDVLKLKGGHLIGKTQHTDTRYFHSDRTQNDKKKLCIQASTASEAIFIADCSVISDYDKKQVSKEDTRDDTTQCMVYFELESHSSLVLCRVQMKSLVSCFP